MSRFKFFDEDIEQKESPYSKLEYKGSPNDLNYIILQKQKTVANAQVVSDTETKMLWQLANMTSSKDGYQLYLNQVEHDVLKTNSQLQELVGFAKLFNSPTSRLNLRFNNIGEITAILNQLEILSIWQNMKENELLSLVNANSTESNLIIKAGDKDFSDSVPLIKNGILYQLLFPSFYGMSNQNNVTKQQRYFGSNIFNEKRINLSGERIVIGNNADELIINEKFINEKNGDYVQEILKIYNTQYKPIFTDDLAYSYQVKIDYKLFKNSGVVKNIACEVEERLNDNFYFTSHYSFSLKTE